MYKYKNIQALLILLFPIPLFTRMTPPITLTTVYRLINLIFNIQNLSPSYDINQKRDFAKNLWNNEQLIIKLPKEFSLVKILNDYFQSVRQFSLGTGIPIIKTFIEIKTTFNRTSDQTEPNLKFVPFSENCFLQIENTLFFVFKPFGNLIDAVGIEDGHKNSFIGDHVTCQDVANFFINFDDKGNQHWVFDKILCCLNYYPKLPFFSDNNLDQIFPVVLKRLKCFLVNEKRKLEFMLLLIHDQDFYNRMHQEFRFFNEWNNRSEQREGNQTNAPPRDKYEIWPRLVAKFSSVLPLFSPEQLEIIKKSASMIQNKDQQQFFLTLLDCEHLKSFDVIQ